MHTHSLLSLFLSSLLSSTLFGTLTPLSNDVDSEDVFTEEGWTIGTPRSVSGTPTVCSRQSVIPDADASSSNLSASLDVPLALFDVDKFSRRVDTIIAQYDFYDIDRGEGEVRAEVTLIDRLRDPAHVEKELMDSSFAFMSVLLNYIQAEDFEQIGNVIVTLFEANNNSFSLFEWLICRELRYHSDDAQTLFREDNFHLKLISTYLKVAGRQYLTRILGPTVREVEKAAKDINWDKVEPTAKHLAVSFIGQLDEDEISCPGNIRILCALLKREVINVSPGSVLVGLGNIIFLRWIGPAIIHPERYGIIGNTPSFDTRRLLVQVAKLILSCVNGIYCPDPSTLDPWVSEHCAKILQYLITLPKRVHHLRLARKTVGQLRNMDELQLFREVRARHKICLQKLFQYIQVNNDGLANSWNDVKEQEQASKRTWHQLSQKRLLRTLSGYGVDPTMLLDEDGTNARDQIGSTTSTNELPRKSLASQLNDMS